MRLYQSRLVVFLVAQAPTFRHNWTIIGDEVGRESPIHTVFTRAEDGFFFLGGQACVSQERFWEAYVSVDRWLRIWTQLMAIVGGRSQFAGMPQVNAPVAAAMHNVGKSATQIDLFIPVELLVAWKTAMSPVVAVPSVAEAAKADAIVETP
ncbi:MAG: hypothetical protein IIB57_14385 [Planctomycetes bacterium]|nr:hypothetical protein [Planctomycetota bacterium]